MGIFDWILDWALGPETLERQPLAIHGVLYMPLAAYEDSEPQRIQWRLFRETRRRRRGPDRVTGVLLIECCIDERVERTESRPVVLPQELYDGCVDGYHRIAHDCAWGWRATSGRVAPETR